MVQGPTVNDRHSHPSENPKGLEIAPQEPGTKASQILHCTAGVVACRGGRKATSVAHLWGIKGVVKKSSLTAVLSGYQSEAESYSAPHHEWGPGE